MLIYFYTPGANSVFCYSYIEFLLTLNCIKANTINVDKTASYHNGYNVFYGDLTHKKFFDFHELLKDLNENHGFNFKLSRCYIKGGFMYKLYFNGPVDFDAGPDFQPPKKKEAEDAPIVSAKMTPNPKKSNGLHLERLIDWKELEAMYDEADKNGSKEKLYTFIKKTYSIELKRNRTFEQMIEDFKAVVKES